MILLLLSIFSCNDKGFLDENPETFFTMDNVFTTKAQVDQALVTLYSDHRNLSLQANEATFLWRGNGSDLLERTYDLISISFSNYSLVTPEHPAIRDLFNSFYRLINRANVVIRSADLPQITWASESDKAYSIAQARFFRALAYGNLAELWGGVSFVPEVDAIPKYDFKRETRTTIYQFAIDELLAIEDALPVTSNSGGRIQRGAAQHLLCELYLALGIQLAADGKASEAQMAYTNSINYGNKVIDAGTYSLMTSRFGTRRNETSVVIDVYNNGSFTPAAKADTIQFTPNLYWDLFQEGNINYQEGNRECIWAIQTDYPAFKTEDQNAKLGYARDYGPALRIWGSSLFNGTLEDVGGRGVINQVPTFLWREEIWANKWAADMRNSEIVIRRRFKGNVPGTPWYLKVVPWSVIYNLSAPPAEQLIYLSYCYPISCKISTDKFTGVEEGQNRSNLFRDDYAIRLPETILLRAEAKQRSGDKAGAASDVNLLRTRAQCTYLVTAADMDDNFNLILDERARELMYEEHRWNTLLRMGGTIAVDRIKQHMLWDENRATLTRNFNLLPIPQSVIDANFGNTIEQNPGWD